MNDEFRNSIKRLRDIYNYLTEGEPSPDEEEESQKEMITLLESLIMHIPPENMEENLELLKTSLGMAKEWDTLEYWFSELSELVTHIKLILNRFLIRHAEPEQNSKPASKEPVASGGSDELSNQLAAALERAMKNLPPEADVTKVIQSVTSQVTENYMKVAGSTTSSHPEIKVEPSSSSSDQKEPVISQNYGTETPAEKSETMMSTAAKVKIRREDIMKSVLEQAKNKITLATEPQPTSHQLPTPKIIIPKVARPKQKIVPYVEQPEQPSSLSPTEQKYQELEVIPPLETQEKPKPAPKLKVGAFKKGKSSDTNIKTYATTENSHQQPIRPKVVVKPKITMKVEEMNPVQTHPEPEPSVPSESVQKLTQEQPLPKKPKINVQAKPVPKQKQEEIKREKQEESVLKFNVVRPTETSVKDTQIDLFETFSKQEKKDRKRKSKKKTDTVQTQDSKPEQKKSPMEGVEFTEESSPYEKMDKNQLYQELIALEGKKYAIEKSRADYRSKHEKGLISDGNYAAQLDRFKFDLNYISKKINEIRQRIQTL
jgi:hypothetical protein